MQEFLVKEGKVFQCMALLVTGFLFQELFLSIRKAEQLKKKLKQNLPQLHFPTRISTWFRKQKSQKLSRQRKLQVHCMSKLN